MIIQPIGTIYLQDEQGYLINSASFEKIQDPWRSLVQSLINRCKNNLENQLHSLYLRGSIPQGTAIAGISDLDSVLVWRNHPPETAQILQLQQQLQREAPFCQGIEIHAIAYEKIQTNLPLQTLLKVQGLCLDGIDLIPTWPAIEIGRSLLLHTPHLEADLISVKTELRQLNPQLLTFQKTIQESCRWIMKRCLRSGYELVMEREKAYTRDLYPCYEGFTRYYPQEARLMYKALELAIAPSRDRAGLLLFLDQLGPMLLSHIESQAA